MLFLGKLHLIQPKNIRKLLSNNITDSQELCPGTSMSIVALERNQRSFCEESEMAPVLQMYLFTECCPLLNSDQILVLQYFSKHQGVHSMDSLVCVDNVMH